MNGSLMPRPGVMHRGGLSRVLLFLLLLLPLTVTPAVKAAPRGQQALLDLAAQRPDSTVGIIVQKSVRDSSLEGLVTRLGGTVTKDLSIINAFAATLPAKAVPEVASASGVRWVSLDSAVEKSGSASCQPWPCMATQNLVSPYPQETGASSLWNTSGWLQGQNIGVAVVDSGINPQQDLNPRVTAQAKFNSNTNNMGDSYGHGTHVAGIIAGDGTYSNGTYIGIAPRVNLINVKVSDDQGGALASDVVAGLQWVLTNASRYNIKVVNLSLNSSTYQSYNVDPIDAACEVLWFNSIVVVVSAGNTGTSTLFPPANDPFVITVGATDDRGTTSLGDDIVAPFSAYGITPEGVAKPDLVAPGINIISLLASNNDTLAAQHPDHLVSGFTGSQYYFRMSGTSMAAPMVSGAAALLLQDEPNLTPDQVKYRLKATATRSLTTWPGYNSLQAGSGYLNIYGAVTGITTSSANTNIAASQLLWTGGQPVTWGSVNWNSVNWNSVNWNSVNWNSVNWNSVNWNSDYWGR